MDEEHELQQLNQVPTCDSTTQSKPLPDFFILAKQNKWEEALRSIQRSCLEFTELMDVVDSENEQNILHLASQCANHKDAVKYTEYILKSSRVENKHDLITFVNQCDKTKQAPLHIGIKSGNKMLVELLLRNGADVALPMPFETTEKTISILYSNFSETMLTLFDENLHMFSDKEHSYKKDKDQIRAIFTPIVGKRPERPNSFERYTIKNLAVILKHTREIKSTILVHPLVQLFLHYKHKEYRFWIYFSAFVHIFWNILSFVFIFQNASIPVHSNNTETPNNTIFVKKDEYAQIHLNSWYFVVMYIIWPIFTIKETIEYNICPDKSFYKRQYENIGQWAIIIFDLFVFASTVLNHEIKIPDTIVLGIFKPQQLMTLAYLIGMPLSVLLIQGQIYKFRYAGIYIEMFRQCLKTIAKLVIIFCPLLASFITFFHVLLPKDSKFSPSYGFGVNKLLVMMTGEFDYEKLLETTNGPPFVLAQIIFFVFVISVPILLQNLLIGLTVSDVQELRKRANERYLETLLENLYLHESFWIRMQTYLRIQNRSIPNDSDSEEFRLYNLSSDLQESLAKWQKTQKSNKKICKSCGSTDIMDDI